VSHSGIHRQPLDRDSGAPPGGTDPLTDTLARRGTLLVGGFGTGKTEIAVSLARRLAASAYEPHLIDLDIVTPYFRPRDISDELEAEGVRVVAPEGDVGKSPLPAVTAHAPQLLSRAAAEEATVIVDPGGEASGAGVIRSLIGHREGSRLLMAYVLNAHRESYSGDRAQATRRTIEDASGLTLTHLISNTHLGRETAEDTVLQGLSWAREIADAWELPLLCIGCPKTLLEAVSGQVPDLPILPISPSLGLPWDDPRGPSDVRSR
jgi:hypothetical protein